jgi:hypothetical protein
MRSDSPLTLMPASDIVHKSGSVVRQRIFKRIRKGERMILQSVVERLEQFYLTVFWKQEWSRERILTIALLILFVIVLRVIIGRTNRYKSSKAAKTTEVRRQQSWRTV